ncbi:fimbrial protein [Providencia heimbachae]|uniref:MrfF family protein n=1 Tax=Providencia heimbachae ATCC 35613 TaxID=1354272 RepID=A0A1B7JTV2_9GAMM|nr:fimbrial protein [Providencia heimbachae]OAT51333.1 MrfF family protein [Providencia heimbachae ATCC 35613]SQH11495.1 putative minor fimbrial subunit StfF [Providencia heimbachae]
MTKHIISGLFLSLFGLFSNLAIADIYTLTVKVTVIEKTCDIYGNGGPNQPITVDMEDLIIKKIDGQKYETEIPYQLDCTDAANNPALKMKFDGTQMAGQGVNILKTSVDNLGLALKMGSNDMTIGKWHPFNYSVHPRLSVIPIASGTGGINNEQMTASATLSVEYQ